MLTLLPCLHRQLSQGSFQAWAVLESFLVHVRLLDDFFFSKKPEQDDIQAIGLSSSWSAPPCTSRLSCKERVRINKLLAHFTQARIREVQQGQASWDMHSLRQQVLPVAYDFCTKDPCLQPVIDKQLQAKFNLSLADIDTFIKTKNHSQIEQLAKAVFRPTPIRPSAGTGPYATRSHGATASTSRRVAKGYGTEGAK
ncbi:MAG: hypothetical protein NTU94_03860 [Planctomycetota bacterium]|nr:hypothetical protein [Planctomycetota bacterium]